MWQNEYWCFVENVDPIYCYVEKKFLWFKWLSKKKDHEQTFISAIKKACELNVSTSNKHRVIYQGGVFQTVWCNGTIYIDTIYNGIPF